MSVTRRIRDTGVADWNTENEYGRRLKAALESDDGVATFTGVASILKRCNISRDVTVKQTTIEKITELELALCAALNMIDSLSVQVEHNRSLTILNEFKTYFSDDSVDMQYFTATNRENRNFNSKVVLDFPTPGVQAGYVATNDTICLFHCSVIRNLLGVSPVINGVPYQDSYYAVTPNGFILTIPGYVEGLTVSFVQYTTKNPQVIVNNPKGNHASKALSILGPAFVVWYSSVPANNWNFDPYKIDITQHKMRVYRDIPIEYASDSPSQTEVSIPLSGYVASMGKNSQRRGFASFTMDKVLAVTRDIKTKTLALSARSGSKLIGEAASAVLDIIGTEAAEIASVAVPEILTILGDGFVSVLLPTISSFLL